MRSDDHTIGIKKTAVYLAAAVLSVLLFAALIFPEDAFAGKNTAVKIKVGEKTFSGVLYNNASAKAFKKKLPIKYKMDELNGNEKYKYLDYELPSKEKKVKKIKAGDIMLYGTDCIVVFYKSFKTSYKYTKLGRIKKTKGLKKAAGKGKVTIKISN